MCCNLGNPQFIASQSALIAGMGVAGGTAAAVVTSATVGTVFLTAGLFALPAVAAWAAAQGATCFTASWTYNNHMGFKYIAEGVAFALVSAAVILTGVALSILSPALILPFALLAGVISLYFLALGAGHMTQACRQRPPL